jgi:predicted TIM-barrel fold metal-dependent hydrolase
MQLDDMILVSVDDHVVEPPNAFVDHFPSHLKARAPRVESRDGRDVWVFEGQVFPTFGLNAVVGRPKDEYGMEPLKFADLRKGCWDVNARVDDMNANGVLGSMCFPTFPMFAGNTFLKIADRDIALAAVRAYNDWHLQDWCGAHPGRFMPLAILPLWDPQACADEVARLVPLGLHAITFPDNPAISNLPSIHSPAWDPLWRVCADNKVVICCHIGTGAQAAHASMESPIEAWITAMPMSISNSAADWLFAPMWKKFPSLRMALSEGGIGWIPYFLERADFSHQHHSAWTHNEVIGTKPSDAFRRHIITCFIDDKFGVKNLADVGEEMVTWECDYPHSDCTWPNSPEILWEGVKNLPAATINKITHLNAMREFSFDPFAVLGKGSCSVGALRALAGHVSTLPTVGLGGARPLEGEKRSVTSGDLVRMFAA